MPTKRQQAKAAELVAMGRALQLQTGAAPRDGDQPKAEDPGSVVTGEVIRSYLNRVDGGYKTLEKAAQQGFNEAHATKYLPDAAAYMTEWWPALKRWQVFYAEAIDDWLPSGSTYSETRNYHIELLSFGGERFEKAMGKKPPRLPPLATPDPEAGPLGQITTLVKWGVIAYVGVNVVQALASRSGNR